MKCLILARYLAKNRYIIKPVKIWAQSTKIKNPGYGVTWKVLKIETEPTTAGSGNSDLTAFKNSDGFDSDDEDETTTVPSSGHEQQTTQVFTNEEDVNEESGSGSESGSDSDSDSDSDSGSDSDEEPEPVKKTRGRRAKTSN